MPKKCTGPVCSYVRFILVVLLAVFLTACGEEDPPVTGGDDAGGDTDSGSACQPACEDGPNSTAVCNAGTCELSCDPGYSDTNGDPSDGCEDGSCEPSNGGVEACDDVDNDCDGVVDEGFDIDEDCAVGEGACQTTGRTVCAENGTDPVVCDAEPGDPSPEVCGNDVDEDCDGEIDDEDATDAATWYEDNDGDGYGDPNSTTSSCGQPTGYVDNDGDCDDSDPDTNPDASEICDDVDNDCDGDVDNGCDEDGDGWCDENAQIVGSPAICSEGQGDCNDNEADVYPDAPGLCDGLDNDCNGETDEVGGIPGSGTTVAMPNSNAGANDFPSLALAAPAGDGFCVFSQGNGEGRDTHFAYVEHGQTIVTEDATHFISGFERRVLDVAGDGQRCVALQYSEVQSKLWLRVWNRSTGALEQLEVTDTYLPVTFPDSNSRNNNLYNASVDQISYNGTKYWAVQYTDQLSEFSFETQFARFDNDVEAASGPLTTTTVEAHTSNTYLKFGATGRSGESPNANDDYMVSWFGHSSNAGGTGFKLTPEGNFSSVFDIGNTNFGAQLSDLARIDGTGYFGIESGVSDLWRIFVLGTNYQATVEGTLEASEGITATTKRYFVRHVFAEGMNDTAWFVDGYDDELVLLEPGASDISMTNFTHPDASIGEHLLAATRVQNGGSDELHVLTLTSSNPYTFRVDRLTCY